MALVSPRSLLRSRVIRVIIWILVILASWVYFSTVWRNATCVEDGLDGACGPAGELLDHLRYP